MIRDELRKAILDRSAGSLADDALVVQRKRPGHFRPQRLRNNARASVAAVLPERDVFFNRDGIVVTPSWLEVDGQASFAVRSIVRLRREEYEPPRATARVVFIVALVLAVVSVLHIVNASLPPAIAWIALGASLALAVFAGWLGFFRRSECRLQMEFTDSSRRRLDLPDRQTLDDVHQALTLAMERQRGWQ